MISSIFGRGRTTEETLTELVVKIEEQGNQIATQNNQLMMYESQLESLVNVVATIRSYMEASESRIKHDISKQFSQEITNLASTFVSELSGLKDTLNPAQVVKQISKSSEESQQLKRFRAIQSALNRALVDNVIDGLPLYTINSTSKHPILTPHGKALYDAWSKATVNLAKVCGCKKEKFTNVKNFEKFFKQIGVRKYDKMTVKNSDDTIKTLSAAIIVNGHAKEYTQFLLDIVSEKSNAIGKR